MVASLIFKQAQKIGYKNHQEQYVEIDPFLVVAILGSRVELPVGLWGQEGEEAEFRDEDTEFVKRKKRAKALCT